MIFIGVANIKRKIMPCFQQTVVRRSLLTRIQLHPVDANWLKIIWVAARVLARDLKLLHDEFSRRYFRVRSRLEDSDGCVPDERAAELRTRIKVRGISSLLTICNRVSGVNQSFRTDALTVGEGVAGEWQKFRWYVAREIANCLDMFSSQYM